jgi:GH18 family chitinase
MAAPRIARLARLPRLLVIAPLLLSSVSAGATAHAAAAAPPGFSVFGYLPEWRYSGANFGALFAHLSHLAFFSAEPHPDGKGRLFGLDRVPSAALLAEARAAAARHGTRLLLCLGGNGRSSGFGPTVRDSAARARLAKAIAKLVVEKELDGVDLNWEYPGYEFGTGYLSDAAVKADWDGLAALVADVRAAFAAKGRARGGGRDIVTLAYYPDGRQERELTARRLDESADLLHAMTYDARGAQHSPMSLAEDALRFAREAGLRLSKVTLGLPFYGRDAATGGDWTSYEDLVQRHAPPAGALAPADDTAGGAGFNGVATIEAKVRFSLNSGLGGVMIWESGQDCREAPVTRDGRTHVKTCPDVVLPASAAGALDSWSLHAAISRVLRGEGAPRAFPPQRAQRRDENAIEAEM